MDRNKFLLVFTLILCMINSAFSQVKVIPLSSAKEINGYGVYYALPKTVLNIEVQVLKTQNIKGPYSDYAKKYLGLNKVIKTNSNKYEITNVIIKPSYIPDADQYYYVEIDEKASKETKSVLMSLTESGLIMGVNDKLFKRKINKSDKKYISGNFDYNSVFNYYLSPDVVEHIDTVFTRVDVDTSTIEKQIFNTVLINKTSEDKAKEIADEIMRIKESRYKLLTGFQEVSYDKGAIEYMDSQLKKISDDDLKLFTGVKLEKKFTYHYTYIPNSDIKDELITPLFKFSESSGVHDLSSSIGEKVNIKVINMKTTDKFNNVIKKNYDTKKEKRSKGFYYRIPDYGNVSIIYNKEEYFKSDFLINQFGIVTFLPANKSEIKFYPNTGSIKNVVIEK
ncbi:MAG: DUF4831 family protein [Bacteroidales bacterium]|nr:DUF4831 family protein [Bacteroidales bacterium]